MKAPIPTSDRISGRVSRARVRIRDGAVFSSVDICPSFPVLQPTAKCDNIATGQAATRV